MSIPLREHLLPGTVALIGAGPGPADLMTLRGVRLLAQADVVLCDALLGPEVEGLIPASAERIDGGKRSGDHTLSQDEIHARLIDEARGGKRVVRLKGGDPLVYGRGGEEILALARAGIPCSVVPGISALSGVTALAGIPLTHRGVSDRVLVLSGHGVQDPGWTRGIPPDFQGTLVVFMAADRTDHVATRLLEVGWDGSTPCALVEDGATDETRVLRGTLTQATHGACLRRGTGPGLFICGETSRGLESTDFPTDGTSRAGEKQGDGFMAAQGATERFPVWLDLQGKEVLVVGAGSVALQKVKPLLEAGARVTVVALKVGDGMAALRHPRLFLRQGPIRFHHYWGKHLIIAATNEPRVNLAIATRARARGQWVNAVDDPPACDFYTGAVVKRGPLRLAIGSGGKLPGLSGLLRRILEDLLPPEGDLDLERLAAIRERLKDTLPGTEARMGAMRESLSQLEKTYFNFGGDSRPGAASHPAPHKEVAS